MRNKKQQNPNPSIGFALAAQAVYAAKNGVFDANADDHNADEYREIARDLKSRYGENLNADEVKKEMSTYEPASSLMIRKVPDSLRREFKIKCAIKGISQQDQIIELMREWVAMEGRE